MTTIIYWFRNDLRLADNLALLSACKDADFLLPIYIHDPNVDGETVWGFPRVSEHRKIFLHESLQELRSQLKQMGSDLLEMRGQVQDVFQEIRGQIGAQIIYCEQIEAPEEISQITNLRSNGFEVKQYWQSSMLDSRDLPFEPTQMPDVFTQFRKQVESEPLKFSTPESKISNIPALPSLNGLTHFSLAPLNTSNLFHGGELSARAHIDQYFQRRLPDSYKTTRNQLIGMDYSSKFSPWLASGCCSARSIAKELGEYESQFGENDGTYWLWFELLWRDYFRFLHFKYGKHLYRRRGLIEEPVKPFNQEDFLRWSSGKTGQSFIDAGMRELNQTGYLSNRMRQIVASYWIYDMGGDWRAGAAWFESQLIDYDVYSNQGNWLYIAGRGTDPRGGRAFNVVKQMKDHDPDGLYQHMWLSQA